MRDPRLVELLASSEPVVVEEVQWQRPMRIAAHVSELSVPDELVVSVRCLVQVDDQLVVCTDVSGAVDVLPGGRREPGETMVETVCREIHEETGWALIPDTLDQIGFLHLRNLGDPMPPYPYPDALHVVMTGEAGERAGDDWIDTEGFVVSSELRPLASLAPTMISAASWVFVEALLARRPG
jgi:8-oxo-dGTP pyrophosphatase MutT (NUDIX family)